MTDPIESGTGLSVPRFKADIVIKTLLKTPTPVDPKPLSTSEGETNIVSGPGEYEIKEVAINGWPLLKESSNSFLKSIFRVKIGDMAIGILGHISDFNDPEIFEEMGDIDILFIPGGNAPFISQENAAK